MAVQDPEAPEALAAPPVDTSLMAALKARHDQIIRQSVDPLIVPIHKHWDDALAIKYEYPEEGADPILAAQSKMMQTGQLRLTLDSALDVVLGAAVEIVGRQSPADEWQSPLNDRPLFWGDTLANMLGVDVADVPGKARLLCRHLFSPQAVRTGKFDGDLGIAEHAGAVLTWLSNGTASAGQVLEGE